MYYNAVTSVFYISIQQIRIWAKTWPVSVIPQKNLLLYNDGGGARGDAS